tara:strand:+ start:1814 stop:2128 length:315 start_codon:yes stop_codon:yes gene_type:complete
MHYYNVAIVADNHDHYHDDCGRREEERRGEERRGEKRRGEEMRRGSRVTEMNTFLLEGQKVRPYTELNEYMDCNPSSLLSKIISRGEQGVGRSVCPVRSLLAIW